MEKRIRRQLRTSLVRTACSLFGFECKGVVRLPSFQNGVFLIPSVSKEEVILRFSHLPRRNANQIRAELDWMLFLAANGIRVPNPICSRNGNIVEELRCDQVQFFVCALEYLPGRSLSKTILNRRMVTDWGQLAGAIHRLSNRYTPSEPFTRPTWDSEDNYSIDAFAPADPILRDALRTILAEVKALPVTPSSYGLIHGDIQPNNLLSLRGGLGAIDFDGCVYSWYLHEAAIALFSVLPLHESIRARTDFATSFLSTFFEGYSRELEPDFSLIEHLNSFLKIEEMGEFLLALRSRQLDRLVSGTGRASIDDWVRALRKREPLVLSINHTLRKAQNSLT